MKLKKYNLNGDTINKAIRSDSEMSLYYETNKGTESNPYTIMEYADLMQGGQWTGGYVQNIGYIGKNDFVLASDSTSNSIDLVATSFDFDQYLSSVFSFLYKSSNISFPTSSSNQSSQNPYSDGSSLDIKKYEIVVDGLLFRIKSLSVSGCMELDISGIGPYSDFNGLNVFIKREKDGNVLDEFRYSNPICKTDSYGNTEAYYEKFQTLIFKDNSILYLYVGNKKGLICYL